MSRLRFILSLWRPHWYLLPPLVVLTVLNGVAVAAIPLAIRDIFDTLTHEFTAATLQHSVEWLLAAGVARFLIYTSLQNTRAWMNCRMDWSIRSRLFRHLLTLGPRFYTRYSLGDLVTRLTDDISDDMKLSWFLCSGFFRTLEALTIVAVVLLAMLRLNVTLAWECLVPLPLFLGAFVLLSARLQRRFAVRQTAISNVNAEIEASLSGIHLVKASGAEPMRQQAFHRVATERSQAELAAVRWQALLESLYGYAWQVSSAVVLLLGGRMVMTHTISLADFVAFNGLALSLTYPMFDLGNFVTGGRQSLVFMDRVQALEAEVPEVSPGSASKGAGEHPYEAAEVAFRYTPEGPAVLRNVDFSLRAGGQLAVVGRVGHGKSTLLRLLIRLVDADSGRLLHHGIPLRDLSLDAGREGVGYVPQEAVLLSDTIRENIRFGRALTDQDVERAASLALLSDDVNGLPQGLATVVGPRGVQLSGGQKQRVSLARALAGRPSILLLDDCTASLDAETEARLWAGLRRELPGLTVVVVTHRTQELERADEILVLGSDGAIVERGRHADLWARHGEYRQLYDRYHLRDDNGECGQPCPPSPEDTI